MSKISRSDVFVKAEKGGGLIDEFVRIYSGLINQPNSINDILNAIENKRTETVESVVQKYREQAGLSLIANAAIEAPQSVFLSIRQAKINDSNNNVLLIIKNDPSIVKAIDSFCEHSGGNKGTHAIINFLRNKLSNKLISYSDEDLINYIQERKDKFKKDDISEDTDVGKVGLDNNEKHDDNVADYITHGSGNKMG